jgi:diacylglycerol kinase family enzyme
MADQHVICASLDRRGFLALEPVESDKDIPKLTTLVTTNSALSVDVLHSTLRAENFSNIYVIVSILSGTQLAKSFFEVVLAPLLKDIGLENQYNLDFTTSTTHISEFATNTILPNASAGHKQLLILLSGDGGIIDVTNALVPGLDIPSYVPPEVALIPLGTANALANSAGLDLDGTYGLSSLARGTPESLPTFRVTFSPGSRLIVDEAETEELFPRFDASNNPFLLGAVVCSWGIHAALVADSDTAEYRKFGIDRFKMAAKEALFPADGSGPHPYKARISLRRKAESEWKNLDRTEHAYVLVTLVSNLEKTFKISPSSKPLDKTLRIVHFGPQSGGEVMRILHLAYDNGAHVNESAVSYEEVEGVRIEFEGREEQPRWRRICVDGKIVRVEANGWVEIVKDDGVLLQLRRLGA